MKKAVIILALLLAISAALNIIYIRARVSGGAVFGQFALIIPDSVADRYETAVASVPKDAGKNVYYFTPEQEEILKQLNEKHK